MKVWCVPVNFPDPEKDPKQAEAAVKFLNSLKGLHGVSPHKTGAILLTFTEIGDARAAKWTLEEFADVNLPLIEGTVSRDGKKLNCNKVVKE